MFGRWHHELGTRLPEERRPCVGVESGCSELRHKILVAERCLIPVGCTMMVEFLAALLIHVARVPLVSECGHRVKSPMDEDAELSVFVPPGNPV